MYSRMLNSSGACLETIDPRAIRDENVIVEDEQDDLLDEQDDFGDDAVDERQQLAQDDERPGTSKKGLGG